MVKASSLPAEGIYFPTESYGECRGYQSCKYIGELGGWMVSKALGPDSVKVSATRC